MQNLLVGQRFVEILVHGRRHDIRTNEAFGRPDRIRVSQVSANLQLGRTRKQIVQAIKVLQSLEGLAFRVLLREQGRV